MQGYYRGHDGRTTKKMTENPVVQRMVGLIKEKGKREKDHTDYLGLSPGSMSRWEYDGSNVYIKYIEEIREFLDTTPNYLFFESEDEEDRLSPAEKEIIRVYRSLDNGRKNCIQETLRYFNKSSKKKK